MKKHILLYSLLLFILICSCKKDSPYSKWELGGYIYQYCPNLPIEGVSVNLYKMTCSNVTFDCTTSFYSNVGTDSTGAFYVNPAVTTSIEFSKPGYWFGRNDGDAYVMPFAATTKLYLNKNAWVTIHVTNSGSTKIDTIQINNPFDNSAGPFVIGQSIDTTFTVIAAGDAENVFNVLFLTYSTDGYVSADNETSDSIYVKGADTTLVDLKVH